MKQKTGRKLLGVLLTLAMVAGLVPGMSLTALATDNPSYTLDGTITGGGSAYANDSDITQNNVSWKVKGNTTENPWRIGGKSLSGENRDVYSTGTINSGITEVMLELGYSTITVNSVTLTVASDSSFSTVLAQQTKNGVAANSTLSFKPTSGTWSNAYYKFTFNVTNSNTSNKYVQFKAAKFYAAAATVPVTGVTLNPSAAQTIDVDNKVSFTATVEPNNATDKKVKWSVGGTNAGAVKLYSDEGCTAEVGADATDKLTVYAKGISAGSATVTCTSNADSEKKASCDVTVNEAAGEKAYAAYDVTTSDNKTKSGDALTALQVKFNEKSWYIIADDSTAVDAGTVTLLAAEILGISKFHDFSNAYSTSTIRTTLDNMTASDGSFAGVASAINTVKVKGSASDTEVDAKLYLLDTTEASNVPENVLKSISYWWLRSPGSDDNRAAYVSASMGVSASGTNVSMGIRVRPALKLNLSSVIFSSESKTFSVGSATVDVTGVSLDKTAAQTIEVNGKVSFTATVEPNNATDKKVKWSVGGTDTGAVKLYTDADCTTEVGADATETLTVYAKGISAGSATVTATSNADGEKKASCDVTVNAAEPESTYTLTIPSTLTVANSGWNATDGISATGTLASGKKLTVTAASANSWALKSGDNSVGYTLTTAEGGSQTTSWEFTTLDGTAKPMGIIVEDYSNKPAGNYSDTVTFTASVEVAKSAAETPSIAQADCTFSPSNGKSTLSNANITTSMEYSADNGTTWTDVTSAGSIASLAAGTVQIRVKETGDNLASEAVSITVPEVLHINELVGPYTGDRLTCEYYAGETWQALVNRYDLIKVYSGRAAFGSDGFIYDESGSAVSVTALVDNTKTYEVQ